MTIRLDEFDKVEWQDICLTALPTLSDEQYEVLWLGFLAHLEKKKVN